MNKRFLVIVLDGFGMGAMKDAKVVRPGDESSTTLGSILKIYPDMKLPHLEQLGLMNAYGKESQCMQFNDHAVYGKSELMHYGADTFMGHQEIMGTRPKKPVAIPFQEKVDTIESHLRENRHHVEIRYNGKLRYLLVDHYCTVADNIDADLGMAYNCTAPLDFLPFEKELEIAKLVREIATVNRVIVFGGTGNTIEDVLAAEETRGSEYIGIHAVKSKSYEQGYQCLHLGYGVDETVQVPSILANAGIQVSLFGKVADIVSNKGGKSVSCVDTAKVLDMTIQEIETMKQGFICTNVQETDLAGHSQDACWYKTLLEIADEKIGMITEKLNEQDILVVMADHGNDPLIGHNKHTRENVPLLIYKKGLRGKSIGLRHSLSDVGATICEYFSQDAPQNGTSFLSLLQEQ